VIQIKTNHMASPVNCGVCAKPLVYATESVVMKCSFCGKEDKTLIYCPEGHYICDSCHSKAALDVLRQVLASTKSKDPAEILEQVMSHPSVPMHGPEHHAIVPGVIIAAVRNSGYPLPEGAIDKALERASKVQGDWCGLYGDCGAAVGVGITVSVMTGATPLTGKPRTLAMGATTFAMSRMLDEQPRCCKRASRIAVRAATEFLRERLGIELPQNMKVKCHYISRNQECAKTDCPFFK
jgi:7,8-dihydro-6-hydroxymethylpterin dimethyltransferase